MNLSKYCVGWPNGHASRIKNHFKADFSCISLGNNKLMDVAQLSALTWVQLSGQTVKKLCGLACKFDLDQSELKSSQVKASARKA